MAAATLQATVDQLCALDEGSLTTVIQSVLNARPEVAPAVVTFAVPDLTFAPSKGLTENRQSGQIKSFSEMNGFGFISCPELFEIFGGDVFVHRNQLAGHGVGESVNFAVTLNKDGKPQAYDVQGPPGAAAWGKGKAALFGAAQGGKGGMFDSKGCKGNGGFAFDGAFNTKGKGKSTAGPKRGRQGEMPDDAEVLGIFAGSVKSFSWMYGYGFIECEELKNTYGNDVFVHSSDIGDFDKGSSVCFTAYLNKHGKPQAISLEPEDGAAKRARF